MKLVGHWNLWWRRWSTWLAAVYATVTAVIFANPGLLIGLITIFPQQWRGFAAGGVFVLAFIIPVAVAHISQPSLKAQRAPDLEQPDGQ